MQNPKELMNGFDWAGKTKHRASKTLCVWNRNQIFEIFQENREIFGSKSLWKIDFFHNF